MAQKLRIFDKYKTYSQAVQCPEVEMAFLSRVYRELRGKNARIFVEDFGGTFLNAIEWVRTGRKREAYAVDIDPEPLEYGIANHLKQLKKSELPRLHLYWGSVLDRRAPHGDLIAALNFSAFFFKERREMLRYLKRVHQRLRPGGVFVMDGFGGPQCYRLYRDKTKFSGFTYYWQQKDYNPVTQIANLAIHFKRRGEKMRRDVFTYHWRIWSFPELRDLMAEAGFRRSHVYWEQENRLGGGSGVFERQEVGDICEAWVAYIVAEK